MNKIHLVMNSDLFNVVLKLVCWCFIKDFASIFIREYWILFFCSLIFFGSVSESCWLYSVSLSALHLQLFVIFLAGLEVLLL